MPRDVHVDNPAAIVGENDEAVQRFEGQRRDDEEVAGRGHGHVVGEDAVSRLVQTWSPEAGLGPRTTFSGGTGLVGDVFLDHEREATRPRLNEHFLVVGDESIPQHLNQVLLGLALQDLVELCPTSCSASTHPFHIACNAVPGYRLFVRCLPCGLCTFHLLQVHPRELPLSEQLGCGVSTDQYWGFLVPGTELQVSAYETHIGDDATAHQVSGWFFLPPMNLGSEWWA